MATEAKLETVNEFDSPMYNEAVGQFDRVAKVMGLDDNVSDRLRVPQKSLIVSFPFRHDTYTDVETILPGPAPDDHGTDQGRHSIRP